MRNELNSSLDKILIFLKENHPVQLLFDGVSFNHSLNYQNIKDQSFDFTFSYDSGTLNQIYSKKQVIIKNLDISDICSEFVGMFDDNDIRYGMTYTVPFLINPPYISFKFS